MTFNPLLVHQKPTDIENVLPPVGELVPENWQTLIQYRSLDGQLIDFDYRSVLERDQFPMPMPVDREGYGTVESTPYFWANGHCDWLNVQTAIERHLTDQGDRPIRLLDFGCASCRFLRQVAIFGQDKFDPWGCDFAVENIQWNKRHLGGLVKTFLNNANPHLPFSDGYFDMIVAFSVFTHIDHFEDAWLLELRRITRPGGLLYLTTQNDAMWANYTKNEHNLQHLAAANKIDGNPIHVSAEIFEQPMPAERLAFRMSPAEFYNCNVWHRNSYLRRVWGQYFQIHAIADLAHNNLQSPVIMSPA